MHLSPELTKKLQEAWAHEKHNSLTYKHIQSILDVNGFKNLASYYRKWAEEESQHSEWVLEFMLQMNIPLSVSNIEISTITNDNIFAFPAITAQIEDSTTKLWQEFYEMSENDMSIGAGMASQFALKLLKEQAEETGKAQDLVDQISNLGESRAFLQIYDNTFEG